MDKDKVFTKGGIDLETQDKLKVAKDLHIKLIYVNLHIQYSIRVTLQNYQVYRDLQQNNGLQNLIKQKMDKVNLMKILSDRVGQLLALKKSPTHYFSG